MTSAVILIAFLLVPVGFLSYGVILNGHHNALIIAAAAIAGCQIKNIWLRLFVVYAALWLLWCNLQYMWAPDLFGRTLAHKTLGETQTGIMWVLMAALIFMGVTKAKLKTRWFCLAIRVVAIAQMAIAISQIFGFDPVTWFLNIAAPAIEGQQHTGKLDAILPTGSLGNTNFLAGFLAVSAMFFLEKWWRLALIPIAFILFKANTTTAAVAMNVGFTIYFFPAFRAYTRRLDFAPTLGKIFLWCAAPAAFGGAIMLYVNVVDTVPFWNDNHRIPAWIETFEKVFSSWPRLLFGFGPIAKHPELHPLHNEWLAVLYKYGIAGFSLCCGYAITVWRQNRTLLAAFVAASVNCLGNPAMHLAPSAFLVILIIGLIERERQWRTSSPTKISLTR